MANITISALPSLATMTNSVVIPVDTGTDTFKMSGANLKNYFGNVALISNGTSYANIASTDGNLEVAIGGAKIWTFSTTGSTIFPGNLIGNGASPAPSINGFDSINSINVSATGNITSTANVIGGNITTVGLVTAAGNIIGGNVSTVGLVTATGNVNGGNLLTTGLISATGNITAARFYGDVGNVTYQQTNTFYVDPGRTQNYTPTGSQISPFFTITAAISAATAGGYTDSNPAFVVLMENITENVTLKSGIWLTSLGTGTHGSPVITGTVTITSSTGSTVSNHYSISNLRIVAPSNGHGILFTGTAPQRLYVRDMWIDANGTGDGIYMDNSGTGSTLHLDIAHLTHSGSGDIYCINVTAGNCYVTDIETTGSTQVSAVGNGAVMTIDGSELDAVGDVVCETYGTGSLTITNSLITNTFTNGNGIKINSAGSTVTVGQCLFNIPVGTGSAVWYNPSATLYGSNIAFASITFFPVTNTTIDPRLFPIPLAVAVGTIASPILYGDITSYSVAQDWDLIDNNASALSFDTVGKAGVLELVTTNSAEGVKMSGYANVVGNITGGNIITAGTVKTTPIALSALTAADGARAFINNSNLAASGNFGAQIGSGGSNTVPAWSDGTNWYIG